MEDVMDICTFLSATSLFSALEPATVQRLAACCRMEAYPEGATLDAVPPARNNSAIPAITLAMASSLSALPVCRRASLQASVARS
jgi:hypothetical protein